MNYKIHLSVSLCVCTHVCVCVNLSRDSNAQFSLGTAQKFGVILPTLALREGDYRRQGGKKVCEWRFVICGN